MFVVNDSQSVALYGLIVEPLKEFTVMVKIGLERVTCFFFQLIYFLLICQHKFICCYCP